MNQPHQRNIAHPFVSNGNEIRQILPPVMTVANQTTIRDDFSIVLSVFLRKYPQKRKETLPYLYKPRIAVNLRRFIVRQLMEASRQLKLVQVILGGGMEVALLVFRKNGGSIIRRQQSMKGRP